MFEKYFRMDDFIDIIEVISCIRLFIAALWGNVIWKQGCFSVAFYDLKILPFKFVTAVSSLTLKCQCHPTRGPLTNQFFVTFLSTTPELSAISWNMSLWWHLPLPICCRTIQILRKQVIEHFLTHLRCKHDLCTERKQKWPFFWTHPPISMLTSYMNGPYVKIGSKESLLHTGQNWF